MEALATSSEHIDALMQRVKPIYLSRTYGVSLPDPDDQTQGWPYEEFLDKLARMKGRLLKGGEPDLDGVAKILLSDWVRGRIPFFVPPPERPEELNQAEAKAKARAQTKGKGKAEDKEERDIGVKQNLGSIMQKNTFVGDDVRPLDVEGEDVPDVSVDGESSEAEEEEDGEGDGEVQAEEELSWNDVFKDDVPQETLTLFTQDDDDGDDGDDNAQGIVSIPYLHHA